MPIQPKDFDLHLIETFNEVVNFILHDNSDPVNAFKQLELLDLIRAQAEQRLPAILSVQEVRQLLSMATPLHNRVYFTTVYHLGLHLQEGLFLQVSDLDGQCLMGHVHRGKGAKIAMSPCPVTPWPFGDTTGRRIDIPSGSSRPQDEIKNKWPALPNR